MVSGDETFSLTRLSLDELWWMVVDTIYSRWIDFCLDLFLNLSK